MKKIIMLVAAAVTLVGGFLYFGWYRYYRDTIN